MLLDNEAGTVTEWSQNGGRLVRPALTPWYRANRVRGTDEIVARHEAGSHNAIQARRNDLEAWTGIVFGKFSSIATWDI